MTRPKKKPAVMPPRWTAEEWETAAYWLERARNEYGAGPHVRMLGKVAEDATRVAQAMRARG